jgi:hypothetical protein
MYVSQNFQSIHTGEVSANFFAVAARPLAMAWFLTPSLCVLTSVFAVTSTRAATEQEF